MGGGVHFSSKNRRAWTPEYARLGLIEHKKISVRNDFYPILISILEIGGTRFPWNDPLNLYYSNPAVFKFIEKKKNTSIAVSIIEVSISYYILKYIPIIAFLQHLLEDGKKKYPKNRIFQHFFPIAIQMFEALS